MMFGDDEPDVGVFKISGPAIQYPDSRVKRVSIGNVLVKMKIPNTDGIPSMLSQMDHVDTPNNTFSEISKYLSALYGMFITIAGCSLSMISTLAHDETENLYMDRWFDSAMMLFAIGWLIFAFSYLFREPGINNKFSRRREPTLRFMLNDVDSGSFYLKMGSIVFAIGGMVYAGLEIGNYMQNSDCLSIVMLIQPILFVIYVMLQLYFIFKNSQFKITKFRALSRFGMIHMIALDLIIWVRTLFDETQHEFTLIRTGLERKLAASNSSDTSNDTVNVEAAQLNSVIGAAAVLECGQDSRIYELMESFAMFLMPCIIEYALIVAGILYIMWQSIGVSKVKATDTTRVLGKPRLFSVDCTNVANGLFGAIVLIVLGVVGMIAFHFYLDDDNFKTDYYASLDVYTMDLLLDNFGIISVIYCAVQFHRKLHRIDIKNANLELNDGLLMLTMAGVYAYVLLSFFGAIKTVNTIEGLTLVSAICELVQTTCQTVFIMDASRRALPHTVTPHEIAHHPKARAHIEKPAREVITFLLAINFVQWIIDIFCTARADANPAIRDFFGTRQYAIMLHITVPLVIFYRFHSTVCLFDIWKAAYKIPHTHPKKPYSRRQSAAPSSTDIHPRSD